MVCYSYPDKIPFQIDEEDYEVTSYYEWHYISGYVKAYINAPKRTVLSLHLFLLGSAPKGFEWDHENKDQLDNRRFNLRPVTHSVNMRNRRRQVNNTSGFVGVFRCSRRNKWRAAIKR